MVETIILLHDWEMLIVFMKSGKIERVVEILRRKCNKTKFQCCVMRIYGTVCKQENVSETKRFVRS